MFTPSSIFYRNIADTSRIYETVTDTLVHPPPNSTSTLAVQPLITAPPTHSPAIVSIFPLKFNLLEIIGKTELRRSYVDVEVRKADTSRESRGMKTFLAPAVVPKPDVGVLLYVSVVPLDYQLIIVGVISNVWVELSLFGRFRGDRLMRYYEGLLNFRFGLFAEGTSGPSSGVFRCQRSRPRFCEITLRTSEDRQPADRCLLLGARPDTTGVNAVFHMMKNLVLPSSGSHCKLRQCIRMRLSKGTQYV